MQILDFGILQILLQEYCEEAWHDKPPKQTSRCILDLVIASQRILW